MVMNRIVKPIIVALSLITSSTAFATYQYTYTSGLFQYVNSDDPTLNVSTDSFVKIVIKSETLLDTFADNPLANATWDFSVEGLNTRARPDGFYGDIFVASNLLIRQIGQDGLPFSYFINYTESDRSGVGPSIGYYATNEMTQFFYGFGDSQSPQGVYAAGGPGTWQLSQISSPVPELPEFAMFMAGLGIIGFVNKRRQNKNL